MPPRKGTLLERSVERVLKLAGFKPELNKKIKDYEIDIYVKYKTLEIAFECKQYERSTLAIRNLIHQWDSKNKELNFSKIVLVLVGCNITDEDRVLAGRYGIAIWDTEKFKELFDEAIEKRHKMKNKLLIEAGLRTTDEIDEEIRKVKNRYGCPESMAVKFIRGEISEKTLDKLPRLPPKIELSENDFKKFVKNSSWYGIPFRKIVEVMKKYNLKDKKMARALIRGSGSGYSKTRISKIKLLMDELGFPFSKAERDSEGHRETTLREVVEIIKENRNISFNQALRMRERLRRRKKKKKEKKKKPKKEKRSWLDLFRRAR